MRTLLSVLVVLAFAIKLLAEDTNSPAPPKTTASAPMKIGTGEATNHYDEVMIVTGRVAQVTIRPRMIFLNLDRAYPDTPFTVVMFPGKYLADAKALEGKAVEIKGKIKNYHDKPEIELDNTNQLTVPGSGIPIIFQEATQPTNAPVVAPSTNAPPPSTESTNFPEIM